MAYSDASTREALSRPADLRLLGHLTQVHVMHLIDLFLAAFLDKDVDLLKMMLLDPIWRTALMVALFNACLFSYYQLAPFNFEKMDLSSQVFGASGIFLAVGVGLGSWFNKRLLHSGWSSDRAVLLASFVGLLGGTMVLLLVNSDLFILPMILVVMAYGIAIPNILASALTHYSDRVGTAGALLGLLYYLMLGGGLALAGWSQNLGIVLVCSSGLAVLLAVSGVFFEKRLDI